MTKQELIAKIHRNSNDLSTLLRELIDLDPQLSCSWRDRFESLRRDIYNEYQNNI